MSRYVNTPILFFLPGSKINLLSQLFNLKTHHTYKQIMMNHRNKISDFHDQVSDKPLNRAPERMMGLAKGLSVIESFDESHPQMTVADVSKKTRMTRATARRCLLTLTESGYLTYDGKYFSTTPRLLRLSDAYLRVAPLPVIAQPILEKARDILGETVSLAIYDNDHSVFVARAEAENFVSTGVRLGKRIPAYSCATGRVLLSILSDEMISDYLNKCSPVKKTPKTVVSVDSLFEIIKQVRKNKYATTDEELEIGARSLAVPVYNAKNQIVASMAVSAFTGRITMAKMIKQFLPVLVEKSRNLGQSL